jgi:hypothetical protein
VSKDRGGREGFLQGSEGSLGLWGPAERDVLLEQGREGRDYVTVCERGVPEQGSRSGRGLG